MPISDQRPEQNSTIRIRKRRRRRMPMSNSFRRCPSDRLEASAPNVAVPNSIKVNRSGVLRIRLDLDNRSQMKRKREETF
jgi:hypothetical protein